MILVDTSVWIDYFKGVETQESNLLDIALINYEVAIVPAQCEPWPTFRSVLGCP